MARLTLALAILTASMACAHASSNRASEQQAPVETDSNFVTQKELWHDAQAGHAYLYDALESTRPDLLKSNGHFGYPWVYFEYPFGAYSVVTDVHWLEKIPTARVKWIRRYWSNTAPIRYKSEAFDWVLVVAYR